MACPRAFTRRLYKKRVQLGLMEKSLLMSEQGNEVSTLWLPVVGPTIRWLKKVKQSQQSGTRTGMRSSCQKVMLSSYSDSSNRTVQPPSRPTLWSRKRSQGRWSRTFIMAGS